MKHFPLTELPTSALFKEYLNDPSSVFPTAPGTWNLEPGTWNLEPGTVPTIVSGQQIGLLGGPLYTLLKIRSARALADEYSNQLQTAVDAVFWLEDNDHDAAEASTVSMPRPDGGVEHITVWDGANTRIPVSQRSFNAEEVNIIDSIIERLDGRYADEMKALLRQKYTEHRSWSDAFLDLLEPILETWNIRVVKGSDVIASGAHAWLVERDLTDNGELERIVADTTQRLVARGFHAQAAIPDSLFFYHDEHGRHKMIREGSGFRIAEKFFEASQLLETLHLSPKTYSPSVLARPLVQDRYANTIASVLGAAEIAYHAQLTDLYQYLGVQQPVCVNRHMACVLDARTERLLEKSGKSISWFFRHWEEIESQTVTALATDMAVPHADAFGVDHAIAPFREAAERIDPTLVKTAEAAGASIRATLEALEGKLRSAVKRSGNLVLDRIHNIWWNVYPDAVLSERVYPLALWMSRLGPDALRIIVERICTQQRTTLTIIGPSDIEKEDHHAE